MPYNIVLKYFHGSLWEKIHIPFLLGNLRFTDTFFIWTGTKEQLKKYLSVLYKKQNFSKFQYKISQTDTSFLDREVFIQNSKLNTEIYYKKTDWQNFFHVDSKHSKLLKDSIPYNQVLRIKQIYTTSNTPLNTVRSSNKNLPIKVTN